MSDNKVTPKDMVTIYDTEILGEVAANLIGLFADQVADRSELLAGLISTSKFRTEIERTRMNLAEESKRFSELASSADSAPSVTVLGLARYCQRLSRLERLFLLDLAQTLQSAERQAGWQ